MSNKVCLLGAGHFGSSIAKGFIDRSFCLRSDLTILQRGESNRAKLRESLGCRVVSNFQEIVAPVDLLILCIRPQDFFEIKKDLGILKPGLVVSVMAGISLAQLQEVSSSALVRAMPNIAAPLGMAVTVYKCAAQLAAEKRMLYERLIAHWGVGVQVEDEGLLDAATAISGSGPGIFYWFLQQFVDSAKNLGFSAEVAEQLARCTVRGSITYWESHSEKLAGLVGKVASKGGTTEAAIKCLSAANTEEAIKSAFKQAAERCRKLRS
jgi:pyrroline-5-carboxylate reductase